MYNIYVQLLSVLFILILKRNSSFILFGLSIRNTGYELDIKIRQFEIVNYQIMIVITYLEKERDI